MYQEKIGPKVKPKTVEVDYSLDEIEENNLNLIRYEMNAIEFPLFTKNKRIDINTSMKYVFNRDENRYLSVTPTLNNKIPGEFEERIFIALMKLYRKNNYDDYLYVDFYTLISEMNVSYSGRTKQKVREGLNKIRGAEYVFNNCFYSNSERKVKSEKIMLNLFNIRYIDFKEEQEVQGSYLKYFRNSKIKELIQISFDAMFLKNITQKGFLRFDSSVLLEMTDTTARDIYKMITKWRNKKLYIKLFSRYLASRIPLSYDKKNISYSIKRLERAIKYLEDQNLIKGYKFTKNGKIENSFFELFFERSHNFDFYSDSVSVETGQENYYIEDFSQEKRSNFDFEVSESVIKAFKRSQKSIYVSRLGESLKTAVYRVLINEGEEITIELLNRMYKYNKPIENLPAFITGIVKNIKLEKNSMKKTQLDIFDSIPDKNKEVKKDDLYDKEEVVFEYDENELSELGKEYLERAMRNVKS